MRILLLGGRAFAYTLLTTPPPPLHVLNKVSLPKIPPTPLLTVQILKICENI